MRLKLAIIAIIAGMLPASAALFSGAQITTPPVNLPATMTVYNKSGSSQSGQLIAVSMPVGTGDIPSTSKYQVYKADGVTPITTQEDGCSTWLQDGSRKACTLTFVQPDSIAGSGNIAVKVAAVTGTPNTTPNVTTSNVTSNTNFCLKTSDLTEADGTAETGTWDLYCLNYVIANCTQFNSSTGFGSNPACGWEVYAKGPNRFGIKGFQFARRESDGAIHKWLRTNFDIDFWGSGSTPCKCSLSANTVMANIFGPLASGTVGPSTEGSYVYSSQLMSNSTVIKYFGGTNDSRNISTLTSTSFDPSTGYVTLPSGNWTENTQGVFPVRFTSTGSMPTGLTSGAIYWVAVNGGIYNQPTDKLLLYGAQCQTDSCTSLITATTTSQNSALLAASNYLNFNNGNNSAVYVKFCPTSTCVATTSDTLVAASTTTYLPIGAGNTYIAYLLQSTGNGNGQTLNYLQGFSTSGSGTITMTPYVPGNPFTGMLWHDTAGGRIWVDAANAAMATPPTLIGHDFTYLSQKSKAIPPYIAALAGNLLPDADIDVYYPGAYFFPADLNQTGDATGDPRIGYMGRSEVYSLMMPNDQNAMNANGAIAASWARYSIYLYDETVGQLPTLNNGHSNNGVAYAALGTPQPTSRSYPYNTGSWLSPNYGFSNFTALSNQNMFFERYGIWVDGSHLPAPMQGMILKTGAPEWQDMLSAETNATLANFYFTSITIGSNTYARPIGNYNSQTRGMGWQHRALGQTVEFIPDSSPLSPYFRDLNKDNLNYYNDYTINSGVITSNINSLGYFWSDVWPGTGSNLYQWWQNDYHWLALSMEAWRNEYPNGKTWLTTYYYRQVINRMDASISGASGPGCLYMGPSRYEYPYGSNSASDANLATTWSGFFSGSYPIYPGGTWSGCPSSGLIPDFLNTDPGGLTTISTMSPAMASLLGITDGLTIYNSIRNIQYNNLCGACSPPLSFVNWQGASQPQFAIGPLGAVN